MCSFEFWFKRKPPTKNRWLCAILTPPAQKAEFFPTLKCNEQNPKTPA